jgi:hypothetical protein
MVIVPAIVLGLFSWPHITRTVRERGLEYPAWGGHALVCPPSERPVPGCAGVLPGGTIPRPTRTDVQEALEGMEQVLFRFPEA